MSFLQSPRVRVSEHGEYYYSWIGCEVKCSDKQDNDQDRCSVRQPSTERNVDIQWNMQLAGTGASARVVRREVCWTLHVSSPCIHERRWRLSVTIWNVQMIGRRETAEIFRGFGLADPGNCKYWDIVGIGNIGHGHIALHSVHTSPPCRAHIIAYPRYRSTTGKFGRERKIVKTS